MTLDRVQFLLAVLNRSVALYLTTVVSVTLLARLSVPDTSQQCLSGETNKRTLTLNLLMTTIFAPPSNASKWQIGFNSAFKGMHKKPTNTPIIHSVYNYVWQLLHVSPLHCHLQGAFLVPSEICSIEEQSIEYCGWEYLMTWCAPRTTSLDTTRPSTIFYRLLLN